MEITKLPRRRSYRMPDACPQCGTKTEMANYRAIPPKGRHCSRMRRAFTTYNYNCLVCDEDKSVKDWVLIHEEKQAAGQ